MLVIQVKQLFVLHSFKQREKVVAYNIVLCAKYRIYTCVVFPDFMLLRAVGTLKVYRTQFVVHSRNQYCLLQVLQQKSDFFMI
jgi:hypothetical protein